MVDIATANAQIEKASVNMDRFDRIVNGNADEVVAIDGGSVRTLSGISKYGNAGASAYQIWLSQGNSGSEADFINSLRVSLPSGKFVA